MENVYHVMPQGDGRWCARREGERKNTVYQVTKSQCVAQVKALAGSEDAHVVIHDEQGSIEEEFTYMSAREAARFPVGGADKVICTCSLLHKPAAKRVRAGYVGRDR